MVTVQSKHNPAGNAWYAASRLEFLSASADSVVNELAGKAAAEGWHIEPQQHEEWDASVGVLQEQMRAPSEIEILRGALREAGLETYASVILEYDFRRRGLRLDCVLLAPGIIAVIEFKRSSLTLADSDQVTNYCVNLIEFHEETQKLCANGNCIVVPILVQTRGRYEGRGGPKKPAEIFHREPWGAVVRNPLRCDSAELGGVLREAISLRRGASGVDGKAWLQSPFSPSSTILDAAISLFGDHDVSAIDRHAGSIEQINAALEEVAEAIQEARQRGRNCIILVSGSPGSGKTLLGLKVAFDNRFREHAVFVTGNAPLVDVLTAALKNSYRTRSRGQRISLGGYPQESATLVINNSLFKIVKAHHFLGQRGRKTAATDGSIVVFDEAQRTYEKGKVVLNERLEDHEADLILRTLELSYAHGAVLVGLIGHNQAINRGERGATAWLEAAERRGWHVAVADETLDLIDPSDQYGWRSHSDRLRIRTGHLGDSLRFYRNSDMEVWAHHVVEDHVDRARELGKTLADRGHRVWLTRDIEVARNWAREQRVGDERVGLIASGQARRLAAEGLFVDHKPPIAQWMLAPAGDLRSSNSLETVQNQYQIQGLELDYTIVCWDADLRRGDEGWEAWKLSGSRWQRDSALEVAKNSYRVLLTRARKGMVIFVPLGDETDEDRTRDPRFYADIARHLLRCGAKLL